MEKILLLINHKRNRSLLQKFLVDKYEVIVPDDKQLRDYECDLIISDSQAIKKFRSQIKAIKKEAAVLFPVILVTSQYTEKIKSYLGNLIDELILTPIQKEELKLRIDNLLKSRRLSVEAQQRYHRLAENSPVGICVVQEEKISYINSTFKEMCCKSRQEILGANFFDFIHQEDREEVKSYYKNVTNPQQIPGAIEIKLVPQANEVIWVDLRMADIFYQGVKSKLLIMLDITKRKQAQNEVDYLNYHDRLTDLYNRSFLKQELDRLDTKRQVPISIIMGDVNGLKLVNDAFGHQKGDQLLQQAAQILQNCCREEDIVTRWGGDEFVILLPQTPNKIAQEICTRIKEACANNEEPVQFNIALGVGTKEEMSEDIDKILNNADDKMYKNKLEDSDSVHHNLVLSLEEKLPQKTYEKQEHIARLKDLGLKLGQKINLSESEQEDIELLARLHDLGKVSVPENFLKKKEKLTSEEWTTIKEHSEIGYNILKSVPKLASVAKATLSHHEWWDGSGYPQGLAGKDIPLLARIFAIIDAYDVMTQKKSYKQTISHQKAIKELKNKAGIQFDPDLVEKFIELIA